MELQEKVEQRAPKAKGKIIRLKNPNALTPQENLSPKEGAARDPSTNQQMNPAQMRSASQLPLLRDENHHSSVQEFYKEQIVVPFKFDFVVDKMFSPKNANSNLPALKSSKELYQKTNFSSFKAKSNAARVQPKDQKANRNNQYGDFYKNLMRPYGGNIVDKLAGQRNPGVMPLDSLKSNTIPSYNQIDQLKSAKNSFAQMIQVFNNQNMEQPSIDNIPPSQRNQLALSKILLQDTVPDISIQDSFSNQPGKESQLSTYKQKLDKIKNQHKNFSLEKADQVYQDYVKEQKNVSISNLKQSVSQQNLMKERLSLKNHFKQFKEEATYLDGYQKEIDEEAKKAPSKERKKSSTHNESTYINSFKNVELVFGRKDVETFEQIVNDLLTNQISVEDIIDKEEIEKLMKSKFYAGYSLGTQTMEVLKQAFEDEYGLNFASLQECLQDKEFCRTVNKSYQRHLRSYLEAVQTVKGLVKEHQLQKDDYASVIELFKNRKAEAREKEEDLTDEEKVCGNKRYVSFILYMALQEMIKQVFVNCKEKGRLFLKLFKKYFEEQENHWLKIVSDLNQVIEKLKGDREYLLCKFVDKTNKLVDNAFIKQELTSILEEKAVTQENLIEHKRLITQLIGCVNREEDERYLVQLEKKNVDRDVRDIVHQWDLIRANLEFKERIKKVNVEKIKEGFNVMDEIRVMRRDDQAVLVNLERMRQALSNSGDLKWDLEKIQMESQNKLYKEENGVMKGEMKRMREQLEYNQEMLQESSKEIFQLQSQLKKFTSKLDIIERENREVQTDLCFKNEEFTSTMDEILQNKLHKKLKKVTKLMKKASSNMNNLQPMEKQEVMDMVQGMFMKKSQEINTKNELNRSFDDFVYAFLVQRFGTKKKIDQMGQEFLLGVKKFALEDERIDFFKHFLGFEEQHPYNREVLEFYLKLMKSTNESVQSLMMLPGEGEAQTPCQKVYLEFNSAYEKYLSIYNNSSRTLKEEMKKHLIFDSDLLLEGQTKMEVKLNDKWELYALLVFMRNLMKEQFLLNGGGSTNVENIVVEKLGIDQESNYKLVVEADAFEGLFLEVIGDENARTVFELIDKQEFFEKYFGQLRYVGEELGEQGKLMMQIKGLKKIFKEKYEFKINLRKFLDLGLKMGLRFLEEAKRYYGRIFEIVDTDCNGHIDFYEFRSIMKKVDPSRADWKIHAIFQNATGVEDSDKGLLKFDQFIKCSMNNMLMENMIDWEKVLLEEGEQQRVNKYAQGKLEKKSQSKLKSSRQLVTSSGHSGQGTERSAGIQKVKSQAHLR